MVDNAYKEVDLEALTDKRPVKERLAELPPNIQRGILSMVPPGNSLVDFWLKDIKISGKAGECQEAFFEVVYYSEEGCPIQSIFDQTPQAPENSK